METNNKTLGGRYILDVENSKKSKSELLDTLFIALEKDTTLIAKEFVSFIDEVKLPAIKEVINLVSLKTKLKIDENSRRVEKLEEKQIENKDKRIKKIIEQKIEHISQATLSPFEYVIIAMNAYVKEGEKPENFKTDFKRHYHDMQNKDKILNQSRNEQFAM